MLGSDTLSYIHHQLCRSSDGLSTIHSETHDDETEDINPEDWDDYWAADPKDTSAAAQEWEASCQKSRKQQC